MDQIRDLTGSDTDLLERATVDNVNWAVEQVTIEDVRAARELAHYTRLHPERGDFGLVAERGGEAVGVAWALFLPTDDPGYGFVDDAVPELALWVRSDVRRQGVGRMLLRGLQDEAVSRGLPGLSLSVEDGNHARHLYESEGFVDVAGREAEGVMLWRAGSLRIRHLLFDSEHLNGIGQSRQMSHGRAAKLAHEAFRAAKDGSYRDVSGTPVDWGALVEAAAAAKVSIPPDAALPEAPSRGFASTAVELTNETTLGAARRLTDAGERPLALNYANGFEPGGGWLHGALAQEEVLCRSSALEETLHWDPMYAAHDALMEPETTAWVILSPDVPVFRTDDGVPLRRPWTLSFVTSAAPEADLVGQPRSGDLLAARIHRVLAVARAHGYTTLVLGAWGCGAFANDPHRTASDFRSALETEFRGAFAHVVFAIPTRFGRDANFAAFAGVFGES